MGQISRFGGVEPSGVEYWLLEVYGLDLSNSNQGEERQGNARKVEGFE